MSQTCKYHRLWYMVWFAYAVSSKNHMSNSTASMPALPSYEICLRAHLMQPEKLQSHSTEVMLALHKLELTS